jgi:hypothetical protein
MPATEFRLHAYQKPIQYVVLILVTAASFFLAFAFSNAATLGMAVSITLASLVSGAALAFMLWKDHRRQPAGVLRLSEGKLEYTGSARGPVAFGPGDVRDMVEQEGLFVLRLKRGAALIIEPARLEVPLSQLRTALATWMLDTSAGVEFVNETERAQKNENLRVKIVVWAGGAAIVARLLVKLLQD